MNRPGDLEAAALAYLDSAGISAGTQRPSDTDWQAGHPTIVRVTLVDRSDVRQLVLDDALLTVEVWDADSVQAFDVASQIAGHIASWAGVWAGVLIYEATARGPRSLEDPATRTPRYLVTVSVTARRLDT